MTARRWWLAGVSATVVIFAAVVVVVVWILPTESDSDCTTVRELVAFNKAHNEKVTAQSDPNDSMETSVSDYEAWAAQMRNYADEISDPQMTPHAQKVADLASQTVTIVQQARNDSDQTPETGPPSWVQEYAQTNLQYRNELTALESACPV